MAQRQTRLVIKNNQVPNAPFSGATLLKGEAIVNTADGIMMFSGNTLSTSEWTPAGTGANATFFEVGSNLYDLRLRNRITKYEGQTGGGLVGKFLSGTTNGFVLADISDIANSVDSYTTGATWNPNVLTLGLNNGKPNVSVTIDAFTALTVDQLTVTGLTSLSGSTYYYNNIGGTNPFEIVNVNYLTGFSQTNDVYVTGNTLTPATNNTATQSAELSYHGSPLGGPHFITTENKFTTGGTYDNNTALITFDKNDGSNYTVDLSSLDLNDTFVTGGTVSYDSNNLNATLTLTRNDNVNVTITGLTDVRTTGATLIGQNVYFNTNQSLSAYTLDLSALDTNDTYVTGFTYNPATNTFTILQNEGEAPLSVQLDSVSGLTVSNLTAGRVVYAGPSGLLSDEAGFTYNSGTNTLGVQNIEASGDVTIQGSLTVFGPAISAFTSELYVEDNNITLNYNPTGSTTITSVNSGWVIQDGNGISNGDVNLDIVRLQNLTGLTATQIPDVSEYVALTGYANRGWITQLNDIIIRSSDVTDGGSAGDINGVRVLAEFDILDGGQY